MTTINESLTAKGYTPAALVPVAFGRQRTINEIVIHHWGDRGQTHDGVVNFFVNGPGQTSAHYVVSAGRIDCLVSPEDAAWHCPGKNASSIGIECRPEATDADYATVAELIRTLRAQYGNLPLSKHRDWYATACPGVWDLDRLDDLAGVTSITTQSATISPVEQVTPAPKSEPNSGDKMLVLATNGSEPQVWAGDGILRRPIWTLDTMSASQWLAANKVLGPFYKDGEVQTIPDLNSIGIDVVSLAGKGGQ